MLTKRDIQTLHTIFINKDEFHTALSELRSDLLGRLDAILGEMQAMRDEMTLTTYRVSQHSDQLENHGNRLSTLEQLKPATN